MVKLSKLLYLISACSFLLAVTALSFQDIYLGYVYDYQRNLSCAIHSLARILDIFLNPGWFYKCYLNQYFLRGVSNFLLQVVVMLTIAIEWRRGSKKFVSSVHADFHRDVRETLPSYLQGRSLVAVSICLLLWGTFECLQAVWHVGLRDLAYTLDGLGAYETGERVFSLTKDANGNSLASTSGMTGHDSDRTEIKNERLNKMVEKLYGVASIEMARRQAVLANHLQLNLADFDAAVQARQNAIQLYTRLGCKYDRANNLAFLAYLQTEQLDYGAARLSVDEAWTTMRSASLSVSERNEIAANLMPAISVLGERERYDKLPIQVGSITAPGKPHSSVIVLYVACLWGVCYLILLKAREEMIKRMASRWQAQLNAAQSDEIKIWWLDRLVSLELYRGKLSLAEVYSKHLFRIVDGKLDE